MNEIWNKIRRYRFEAGEMIQEELAGKAGCTRQTIILMEQSRYVPSLALAFRIVRVFVAKIEDIFEYIE